MQDMIESAFAREARNQYCHTDPYYKNEYFTTLYCPPPKNEDNKEPPIGGHFNALHNYLFWGQEALDIAAALREEQE